MAALVSTGEAFSSTDSKREIWKVSAEVVVGTALVDAAGKSGVAYTNSGGHTRTDANSANPASITGIPDGGIGLDALQVSVATDGSYEFAVTGLTKSNSAALAQNGVQVYATITSGIVQSLTLTSNANPFGTVNNPQDYVASADGIGCVKIGG